MEKTLNIEEFKALIETYRNLTLEKIKELSAEQASFKANSIMNIYSGFGNPESCTLCISNKKLNSSNKLCPHCVWFNGSWVDCSNDNYKAIYRAQGSEELLSLIQERVVLMEERLKEITMEVEV